MRCFQDLVTGMAIFLLMVMIMMWLVGCSTQPPEDVQALQSVMQDPDVPLNVKGQYLNWWNAEKDEQRAQMQRNYETALSVGMETGAASRYYQQPVYPVIPANAYYRPLASPFTPTWGVR